MPFAYYDRLSPDDQAVYRASDAVPAVRLPGAPSLWPVVGALQLALREADRARVQRASAALASGVATGLGVRAPRVEVLAVRPSWAGGELHGLYTLAPRRRALVQVWMRTARHARPVAFRTFLRTLLHELCHHLDVAYLDLPRSFHTQGFFQRESSLFHQLVPEARRAAR